TVAGGCALHLYVHAQLRQTGSGRKTGREGAENAETVASRSVQPRCVSSRLHRRDRRIARRAATAMVETQPRCAARRVQSREIQKRCAERRALDSDLHAARIQRKRQTISIADFSGWRNGAAAVSATGDSG